MITDLNSFVESRKHKIENINEEIQKPKMNRFFGMMPSSEVTISKTYKDRLGLKITIDAGKNGWTIMWADYSSDYKDVEDTAENNFQEALAKLKSHLDVTECETIFEETESSEDCEDCEC